MINDINDIKRYKRYSNKIRRGIDEGKGCEGVNSRGYFRHDFNEARDTKRIRSFY